MESVNGMSTMLCLDVSVERYSKHEKEMLDMAKLTAADVLKNILISGHRG